MRKVLTLKLYLKQKIKMNCRTKLILRMKCLIMKCREKGKFLTAIKIQKKLQALK